MRWGQELTCDRVGPWISIRPTSPPFIPLECAPPPSPSPSSQELQPPPHKTLAPPPPLQGAPSRWVLRRVAASSQLEFGGRKKEGGMEEPKVNL
jgi:hypothetical protein